MVHDESVELGALMQVPTPTGGQCAVDIAALVADSSIALPVAYWQ